MAPSTHSLVSTKTRLDTMTHQSLRLTPSNSPFSQNKSPRSPTRKPQEEPGLQLRKVVGATTASSNGFDALPSARCFVYTAGAAAVVATVDEDLNISQRFFRARPAPPTGNNDTSYTTTSPLHPKHRALGTLRESNANSPFSSSVNSRDWADSPNGKSQTAKDRVKSATSVALSPNAKWLAIGESGHKPRILIFSLAEGSSETPVASLCNHTYGVHCLRFSPDSRYLASLGTVNDGFLYVWTVNDRTGTTELFERNKLTHLTNCITWVGKSLLTVGLRFAKVWQPEDAHNHDIKTPDGTPNLLTRHRDSSRLSDFSRSLFTSRNKTLHGNNSILRDLQECNFVAAVPLSTTKAVICAESGEVCILDNVDTTRSVISLAGVVDFNITAARLQENQILAVLGTGGQTQYLNISNISAGLGAASRERSQARSADSPADAVIATADLDGVLVEFTAGCGVTIKTKHDESKSVRLPAHKEAILGVKVIQSSALTEAMYFTYSASGAVHFWSSYGELVSSLDIPIASRTLPDEQPNELRSVIPTCNGSYLIAGDRYGVLMLIDIATGVCLRRLRAHASEISDITTGVIAGVELIATASRDRNVQLFTRRDTELELVQTLNEHAGAVGGVLIDEAGQRLISFSSDRSIVIRDALFQDNHPSRPIVFSIDRTIVIKTSPTAITLGPDDHLYIAAVDRCISKYNLRDGQCVRSFKCADNDGGEAVVMSKITYIPALYGMSCIAGVSSADKSVRLYAAYGALLARDWGHTEGVTDIASFTDTSLEENRVGLITVAADSTMFVWNTQPEKGFRPALLDSESDIAERRLGPPLRKVISQSELSRFSRKKSITDESMSSSPTNITTPLQPTSPHRLRKKSSRSSIVQPPKLEPSAQLSRRASSKHRSPSPSSHSVTNKKTEPMRRRSMATLRSKSSDNVLVSAPPLPHSGSNGYGSIGSSTESLCRTLRSYRKRLVTTTHDNLLPSTLKELDQELRMTLRLVNEKLQGKTLDEASVSKLLEQASERIVEMLDGRIKERVESEVHRKGSDGSMSMKSSIHLMPRLDSYRSTGSDSDSIAGAFESMSIRSHNQ